MGQCLCSLSCIFARDQNFPIILLVSSDEKTKKHKCNCVRIEPLVSPDSSTHPSMPGLGDDSSEQGEVPGIFGEQ